MPPRDTVFKHYARIIQRWPQDNIRQSTVKESLKRRITQTAATEKVNGASPEKQINALYSLLENRYSSKYPTSENLLHPTSNPQYYTNLIKEMEEAPNRSWFQRQAMRLANLVRLR